jgi:hypothetical protein
MKHLSKTVGFLASALMLMTLAVAGANAQSTETKSSNNLSNQGGRDPFRRYEPPRVIKKSNVLGAPSIEERISQYRAQKQAAMNARIAAPKPTTALLLSEVQVMGISKSPRGYAAIVEAIPIKMSFVIYPGERFYDGQLVAIEDNRLVFRREIVFADGKRERSVELKPLRQQSTVDAFTTARSTTPSTQAASAEKSASSNPAPAEKP